MKYKVKAFGITKDIVGGKETIIEAQGSTVGELRAELVKKFPRMEGLRSLFIAVNSSYALESAIITENDEIALIPPVSGG